MTRRVRLHADADAELDAAIEWYEEKAPGSGVDLLMAVDGALARLAESTSHAVPIPHAEDTAARRVLLRRFPYALVFLEFDDEVVVLAVSHYRRRPGYWRDRQPSPGGLLDKD